MTVAAMRDQLPLEVMIEGGPCPLGCRLDDTLVLTGRDRLHGLPGVFRLVRCRTCGLMRTNPRPTIETIGYYYPESYGPFRGTRVDLSAAGRAARWKDAVQRLFQFHTESVPPVAAGRMLEIGCASGRFLHLMAEKGWEVEGIEPAAGAAAAARKLGYCVFTGSVEQAPSPSRPYDLIVGWMVAEHLHEPVVALRKLASWTSPGGWAALSVPNAAALEFRVFRDAWFALQLPTHLFHYTPCTIRLVLEAAGWRVQRVMHQRSVSNFAASVAYALEDRGVAPRLARMLHGFPESDYGAYLAYPLALPLSLLGQTGRMTVWARRV